MQPLKSAFRVVGILAVLLTNATSSAQDAKTFTLRVLVPEANPVKGLEEIIHLPSRSLAVVVRMLGPFVQFEVYRLHNLSIAQVRDGLDEMTAVAPSHMTPLVFRA